MHYLDDSVIARIAQILQEAIVTGTDIVDILRTMELCVNTDTNKLVLTETYKNKIIVEYESLVKVAKEKEFKLNVKKTN